MNQIVVPQVSKEEAKRFHGMWTLPSGIAVAMDDASLTFATDFANVVLRSFVQQSIAQLQAMQQAQPVQANNEPTGDTPQTSLIVEG